MLGIRKDPIRGTIWAFSSQVVFFYKVCRESRFVSVPHPYPTTTPLTMVNSLSLHLIIIAIVLLACQHGVKLSPKLIQLFLLLFADDITLLSDAVIGLQNHLNSLCRTAKHLDLIINMRKSNVVIFRNRDHVARKEEWYHDDAKLEIVNSYKYLGIILSTSYVFSRALNDLAEEELEF